jgi:hypothetical protein
MGAAIEGLERQEAKERQKAAGARGKEGGRGKKKENPSGNLPEGNGVATDSRDRTAESVGMSGRTFEKAKQVVAAAEAEPEKYGDLPAVMDRPGQHGGTAPGKRKDTPANLAGVSNGESRERTAEAVGMGRTSYAKAKAVVKAAEAEPEKFGDLPAVMDRTGKVDGAFREMKKRTEGARKGPGMFSIPGPCRPGHAAASELLGKSAARADRQRAVAPPLVHRPVVQPRAAAGVALGPAAQAAVDAP